MLPSSPQPYEATVSNLAIIPANIDTSCWFGITFSVATDLQPQTIIKIKVPKIFAIVNDRISIECYSRAGIYFFKTCQIENGLTDTFIIFTLVEKYLSQTIVEFDVLGYSQAAFTSTPNTSGSEAVTDIQVLAYFSGSLVAESSTTTTLPAAVYSLTDVDDLGVKLLVSPMNEGEVANYNFAVSLSYIRILKTDVIWIRFPDSYDINFGQRDIVAKSDLLGAIKITRRNRELFMTGMYTQDIRATFYLSIYGVMNPNQFGDSTTKSFLFGILDQNYQLKSLANEIPGLRFERAPNILELFDKSISSYVSRSDSSYNLKFSSSETFLDSRKGGLIKLSLPDEFITDVFQAQCSTQDAFSLYSTCSVDNNVVTLYSSNNAFKTVSSGAINLSISPLRNAESFGESGNIIVYNCDTNSNIVLSRSFPNLSNSFFEFTSYGMEIYINRGLSITLEVGSFSNPITITTFGAFKHRMSIVPLYFDSAFIFSKNPIVILRTSTTESFQIAVPQTMLRTRFYLTFTTIGDVRPQYYCNDPKGSDRRYRSRGKTTN